MTEKMDVNKLEEYSNHICSKIKNTVSENISKLTESVNMLGDMQKIMDGLSKIIVDQQNTIYNLNEQLENNMKLVLDKECEIERLKSKEEEYSKLTINEMKIVAILRDVTEKSRLLDEEKEKLQFDKEQFEAEKERIIREKDDALDKSEKVNKEKDKAIQSRDKAIKENKEFESKIDELNNKIKEYEEELFKDDEKCTKYQDDIKKLEKDVENLKESVKWYKTYAFATDWKVIEYFNNRKQELENHYYNYLNNKNKLEDIRKHFPEFQQFQPTFQNEPSKPAGDLVNNNNKSEENEKNMDYARNKDNGISDPEVGKP